ncbi:hypothetical protein H0Z60_14565 [Ectothiorhodospiraceae bacterium WFHF3C12]|nr:hypothetical protein [Ectothiorhodospiraceae bacterium WFHF3C12]
MAEFVPLFDINVGPHGTFRRSGDLQSTPSQVDELFNAVRRSGKRRVVLHFHGGLIAEQSGLAIARKMTPLYECVGAYPVNIIWETGLWETVTRNLDSLGRTRLFKKLVKYGLDQLRKRMGVDIGGRGTSGSGLSDTEFERIWQSGSVISGASAMGRGAGTTLTELEVEQAKDQIELDLESELQADAELQNLLDEEAPFTELLDPTVAEGARTRGGRGMISTAVIAVRLAKVVYQVLRRMLNGRDHGLYPTLIEELLHEFYLADLGAWVWGGMKDAAAAMFRRNELPLGRDSHVGSYFLERLATLLTSEDGWSVDLVGHSAGSIAICELLKAAADRHDGFQARNILFLAPAVTSRLFHEELTSKPERFERFRMYTMTDALEAVDALFPPLYPRSLLYFISGVLEPESDTHLAGLARHAAGEPPYTDPHLLAVHEFLHEPGANRLVLSVTDDGAAPGQRSASTCHGGFDDDPLTRESLAWMVGS